jgi:hypothetical protein
MNSFLECGDVSPLSKAQTRLRTPYQNHALAHNQPLGCRFLTTKWNG